MCYIYMQSVHNNPVVTTVCNDLVSILSKKRQERIKAGEIIQKKDMIRKQTLIQKVRNRVRVNIMLKKFPELERGKHGLVPDELDMQTINNADESYFKKNQKT